MCGLYNQFWRSVCFPAVVPQQRRGPRQVSRGRVLAVLARLAFVQRCRYSIAVSDVSQDTLLTTPPGSPPESRQQTVPSVPCQTVSHPEVPANSGPCFQATTATRPPPSRLGTATATSRPWSRGTCQSPASGTSTRRGPGHRPSTAGLPRPARGETGLLVSFQNNNTAFFCSL